MDASNTELSNVSRDEWLLNPLSNRYVKKGSRTYFRVLKHINRTNLEKDPMYVNVSAHGIKTTEPEPVKLKKKTNKKLLSVAADVLSTPIETENLDDDELDDALRKLLIAKLQGKKSKKKEKRKYVPPPPSSDSESESESD